MRASQILFWTFFVAFVAAAIVWLALGAAPAIVRAAPGLHDLLHELGGGEMSLVVHVVREPDHLEWPRRVWFKERELTIVAGARTTLTLVNEAPDPHNLSIFDGERPIFEGTFARGTASDSTVPWHVEYTFTAPAPGTYRFRSDSDPEMGGSVVVIEDVQRLPEPFATLARRTARAAHGAETGPLADHERPHPPAQAQRRALAAPFEYAFSILNLGFGILLIRLRPRDLVARLLAIGMIGTAGAFNLQAHSAFDVAPALVTLTHDNFHIVAGAAYTFALLLFPDGRLPSGTGMRSLVAPVFVLAGLFAWLLASWGHGDPATLASFFGILIPVAGITSQVWRYGHPASTAERQQSRVLMLGLGLVLFCELMLVVGLAAFGPLSGTPGISTDDIAALAFLVFPPLFALIPLTLVLLLVRYRLWHIDRLVNRALVYAVLTAILAVAYVVTVVISQRVLGLFTQGSEIAIALSTIAVATLFQPVRGRVQDLIDRAFYRHHFDASRTLDALNVRLRDEVDIDAVRRDVLDVLGDTLEPAHASVWLRGR
jgi:plastocyanin